jgi:hypothetical protein
MHFRVSRQQFQDAARVQQAFKRMEYQEKFYKFRPKQSALLVRVPRPLII